MNKELIKQLFLHAGGPHLYAANETHNDILIRLVITECVNVLEQRAQGWRDNDAALESRRGAQAIREHFGLTND